WRVLLTDYVPSQEHRARMRVRYFRWNEIAQVLKHLSRSTGSPLKFLCSDLVRYLEDKNMIRNRESVEIYAREINEEVTLAFFLKARMYGCNYEASSRVQEALYFAPHFGRSIANAYPGVTRGVSYVAKIEIVEPAETWKDLLELVTSIRGKTWL